jgi:hypothetical protein
MHPANPTLSPMAAFLAQQARAHQLLALELVHAAALGPAAYAAYAAELAAEDERQAYHAEEEAAHR